MRIVDALNGLVYEERRVSDDVSEHTVSAAHSAAAPTAPWWGAAAGSGAAWAWTRASGHAGDSSASTAVCVAVCVGVCVWWTALLVHARSVRRERVLVLRRLGVQVESERVDGVVERRFVPRHAIRAAVINEGVRWNRVVPYAALLPHASSAPLVVLFRHFEPRLACLLRVLSALNDARINDDH